jgi:tRNA threonylcarbamoyladenosine biosynthesis protein TsaB
MGPHGRVLIIETSGRVGQVALGEGGRVVASRTLPEARRHARDLAARIREMLEEAGGRTPEISAVIVDAGPGSYTGLRVGIVSAKAFAYATGCELFAVPGFEAVAAQTGGTGELDVIADAQQGKLYAQRFVRDVEGWRPAGDLVIRPFVEWAAELNAGARVSGPACAMYATRLPAGVDMVPEADREPRAESLLRLAVGNPERYRTNCWDAEPIYLRGSSAEEKRAGLASD